MVATSVRKIVAYQFIVPLHAKYRVDPLKTISPLRCNVGLIKIGSFFCLTKTSNSPISEIWGRRLSFQHSLKLIVRNIPKSYRRYRASLLKTFYSLTLFFFCRDGTTWLQNTEILLYLYRHNTTLELFASIREDRLVWSWYHIKCKVNMIRSPDTPTLQQRIKIQSFHPIITSRSLNQATLEIYSEL